MKLSIITLLLILLLCGCSTHPQNENGKFIRIDIENSANNPFNLSNLSKEVSYIKLETNDSCLINSIKAIFYIDNQIIIRDNNSILFFDNTGKFQYKMPHKAVWISMKNPLLTIHSHRHRSLLELYCEWGVALVSHRQKTFRQQRR